MASNAKSCEILNNINCCLGSLRLEFQRLQLYGKQDKELEYRTNILYLTSFVLSNVDCSTDLQQYDKLINTVNKYCGTSLCTTCSESPNKHLFVEHYVEDDITKYETIWVADKVCCEIDKTMWVAKDLCCALDNEYTWVAADMCCDQDTDYVYVGIEVECELDDTAYVGIELCCVVDDTAYVGIEFCCGCD